MPGTAAGTQFFNRRTVLSATSCTDARFAHEVQGGETAEAREPRDRPRARLGRCGPQPLDLLDRLDVPAADLDRGRLNHLPAPERVFGRRIAQHERLSPGRGDGLGEEQLRQAPFAGREGVAIEKGHRRHHLRGADV